MINWADLAKNSNPGPFPLDSCEVFKYTELKYGRMAADHGCFRIRTLYDYQNIEQFGEVIGDACEGSRFSYLYFAQADMRDLHPNERVFLESMGGAFYNSSNCSYSGTLTSPNIYTYCVSAKFSHDLAKKFCGDKEPCILYIPRVIEFYKAISESLIKFAKPMGFAKIHYVTDGNYDVQRYGTSIHPSLVKHERYAYQCEVRMSWQPLGDVKPFIDIVCPEATKHIVLMKIDEFTG